MDRRMKPEREESYSGPKDSAIVDDVPNIPEPDVSRTGAGPPDRNPARKRRGGWRR